MVSRLLLLAAVSTAAWCQVCRLSVAGLNRNRRVVGDIAAECPDPIHSAPFGNWGVTSNFGPKRNGHQFDGWCRDLRVCDNNGLCFNACRDGWYEWNSCTVNALYKAPNCTLYNSAGCTEQVSNQDVNVLATQTIDVPVKCPRLTPDRTRYDSGGCLDLPAYERTGNFMSAYELDPITGDELVQTVYFPALAVRTQCNTWGCGTTASEWARPIAWDSPASPPKVFAEMAMIVNSGAFVDTGNVCRVEPAALQVLSSASYARDQQAPESLVSLLVEGTTLRTETAAAQPLPTSLGGLQVRVTPAAGAPRNAGLIYASPSLINMVLPAGLPDGDSTVAVLSGSEVRAQGTVRIGRINPAIFTADASGAGPAAAVAIRYAANGSQVVRLSFECGGAGPGCRNVPLDLGSTTETFVLSLYGTGIRGRSDLANVRATIGGLPIDVQFAGAQTTFAGLDQVNLYVPPAFPRRGILDVQLVVDGRTANTVTVWLN